MCDRHRMQLRERERGSQGANKVGGKGGEGDRERKE